MSHRLFTYNISVPDTTYTYYRYRPHEGPGRRTIKTSGSSTTISAGTAAEGPFSELAVGDLLKIVPSEGAATSLRKIVTWTGADTIVVDSAITIATATPAWSYFKRESGTTTATAPRHSLRSFRTKTLTIDIPTLGSSNAGVIVLGWGDSFVGPTTIYEHSYTAVGSVEFPIIGAYTAISVGLKAATPGVDSITITLNGEEI